jgi:hypothetical protein
MPIRKRSSARRGAREESLLGDLIQELKSPRDVGQPIIIEDETPETASMRVHVIWDRWDKCAHELRSGIVMEAYQKTSRVMQGQQLTLAFGLTVPEAVDQGLLPFELVPTQKALEQPLAPEYEKAMIDMGASTLFGSDYPQLRLASLKEAQECREKLLKQLPGSDWIVVRDVYEPDSISMSDYWESTSMSDDSVHN